MQRVGFDSYALKDGKNALYAIEAGFSPFSDAYQTSTTSPNPISAVAPRTLNVTKPAQYHPELTASVATKTQAVSALLADIAANWSPATFANSLGAEDMVLTDLIVKAKLPIEIFSLDTGRLPLETYDLIAAVDKEYGLKLKIYFPQAEAVESFVRNHGINGFYDSVTLRKACCHARKVEPLKRALAGKRAWITGLRAQQATTRSGLPFREYDDGNGLKNSTRCRTGPRRKSGPTSSRTASPTTPCTTSSTPASAAPHPSHLAGRRRPRRPLVVGKSRHQGMRAARKKLIRFHERKGRSGKFTGAAFYSTVSQHQLIRNQRHQSPFRPRRAHYSNWQLFATTNPSHCRQCPSDQRH
jgi:phosphoadenosine phosphosulfate reductase